MRNLSRHAVTILLAVVVGLVAGAIAYASIPDSAGVLHGCYSPNGAKVTNGTTLSIIDSAYSCAKGQQAITWNQTGAMGPAGQTGDTTHFNVDALSNVTIAGAVTSALSNTALGVNCGQHTEHHWPYATIEALPVGTVQ